MGVNPGRIKAIVNVNLDQPYQADSILSPKYIQLNRQVFELIREEAIKSMELV